MLRSKQRAPVPARTTDLLINVAWPVVVALMAAGFMGLQSIVPAREQTTPLFPIIELALGALGFALTLKTAWAGTGGGSSGKATTRRGSLGYETAFCAFGPKFRLLNACLALGFAAFSARVALIAFF